MRLARHDRSLYRVPRHLAPRSLVVEVWKLPAEFFDSLALTMSGKITSQDVLSGRMLMETTSENRAYGRATPAGVTHLVMRTKRDQEDATTMYRVQQGDLSGVRGPLPLLLVPCFQCRPARFARRDRGAGYAPGGIFVHPSAGQ